jgi:hypothetical protein
MVLVDAQRQTRSRKSQSGGTTRGGISVLYTARSTYKHLHDICGTLPTRTLPILQHPNDTLQYLVWFLFNYIMSTF